MKQRHVIYESPTALDRPFLIWDLWRGRKVYVVEPVFAFHYRGVPHFYPKHLPDYVQTMIKAGRVSLLSHAQLNSKVIFLESCDKAVKHVEAVFKKTRKQHERLVGYVCQVLRSPLAENAFKTNLAHRLGELFSMNILLARISQSLKSEDFIFHPRLNICDYQQMNAIVNQAGVENFVPAKVSFPARYFWFSVFENLQEKFTVMVKLFIQMMGALFLAEKVNKNPSPKDQYLLGVAVVSPRRQLAGNNRGPDFLVDHQQIKPKDVVYFVQGEMTAAQQKCLDQLGANYLVPRMGRFFSNPKVWARIFLYSLSRRFLSNKEELDVAALVLFRYFSWQKVLQKVSIKNFVTHCDFGVPHIGRNIALKEQGVTTWYFTDSMNFSGVNRKASKEINYRHPWWTYLTYDHFVTWDESIAGYFRSHPVDLKQFHIVGCLWSHPVNEKRKEVLSEKPFVIGVFDTGYNRHGIGCFGEGIAFTKDILRLADDFSDVLIIFKPKLERSNTLNTDSMMGAQLIQEYDKMEKHPRVKVLSMDTSPGEVITQSDMIISFPFTSTTYEALSVNKPALWHDPWGLYQDTMYGKIEGLIAYGYDQLHEMVTKIKVTADGAYVNPIRLGDPLLDPFRDGKGIERFRNLILEKKLTNSTTIKFNEVAL